MKLLGLILLIVGIVGVGYALSQNASFFNEAMESTDASPSELATGIQSSMVIAWGGVVSGVLGILLIIVGMLRGKPKRK